MAPSGTWYFDLGSLNAFLRGEYVHDSKVQAVENIPTDLASREVDMINASFGLLFGNGVEVMLWGRNLTDDQSYNFV